jgi:tetratricopeptide (TPR) repeat protein
MQNVECRMENVERMPIPSPKRLPVTRKITTISFSVLLLSALVGGIYLQQKLSLARGLSQAREVAGSKNGAALLEGLSRGYPECAEIQFLYARQLRLEQREASAALHQAKELGWPPDQIEREYLLGLAQTDFTKAEPALMARLNSEPGDYDWLTALATGWSRRKEIKKTESVLKSLLERDPGDAYVCYLLGKLCWADGKPHQARAELEKSLQNGAGRYFEPDARLTLANCLLDTSQFDKALETFRQCQGEMPDSQEVLSGIARCYWNLGSWQEAEEAFRALLQAKPDQPEVLSQLAYIYEERGELARAAELLEKASQLNPKWYDVQFRLARIFLALGQKDRGAEYQERAELVKKHWAKPRDRSIIGADPYTGEESKSLGQDAHP